MSEGSEGPDSDDALASRAVSGDASAFEALIVRYQARVYRLACRLTSETDAPDILQDTFLQAYRHLGSFRGDSKFGTWLYRIATNASLMHRRSRGRRPAESAHSLEEFLPRFDDRGAHAETPEELRVASQADELIDRQTLAAKARAAIAQLPDSYRDAFVLRDLEEMPTAEVAAVLGIEQAAVQAARSSRPPDAPRCSGRACRSQIMSDVTCVSGVDLLMDYLEGELPAGARAAIESHVAGCPRCIAFIESYEATPRILRDATLETMPEDLRSSLLAAVRAERERRP